MRLVDGVPLVQRHLDLEVVGVIRVNDRRLHPAMSPLTDQVPEFRGLDDEAVEPIFDADEDSRGGLPRGIGQPRGRRFVEAVVPVQRRRATHRGDQVPDLVKHETFRVEVLDVRVRRAVLAENAPDGRHVIPVLAARGSSADVGQEQHDGGGDHAILNLGQATRVVAPLSPFHIRVQKLERPPLMVDLAEGERGVRLLGVEMQTGKAQDRVNQSLVLRFHGHAQDDFLERIRHVVMDGQDFAQMIREMVQKLAIDVGFDPRGDVPRRSGQPVRDDDICLLP